MLQPREFPETRPSLLSALRSANGGQSAWRVFFRNYAPAVYRVARLRGLDEADADDIVQQVMLAVSAYIDGFEYDRDRGRFRQWVRQITENKIADYFRRSRRTTCSARFLEALPDERPTIQDLWEQEWRLQSILYCLDQVAENVSPRRMEAFRLYVLEGQSPREVAARLGMTEGYVYVTRYYVLGLIRKRIAELERSR